MDKLPSLRWRLLRYLSWEFMRNRSSYQPKFRRLAGEAAQPASSSTASTDEPRNERRLVMAITSS